MTVGEMAEAIGRAHGASLDAVTRALWAGVAAGGISDEDAVRLVEAIEKRRNPSKIGGSTDVGNPHIAGIPGISRFAPLRSKPQRSPERFVAIERRRRLAASGPMPPALAARFTTGELAVLRIVADEFTVRQVCALCLDAIAARAGVSRTLAKSAIRQARRLGMVEVRERRRTGAKSLPNLVRVIDRDWLVWMKRGTVARKWGVPEFGNTTTQPKTRPGGIGGRNPTTTDTKVLTTGTTRATENAQEAVERGEVRRTGIA